MFVEKIYHRKQEAPSAGFPWEQGGMKLLYRIVKMTLTPVRKGVIIDNGFW
jgi:hypothetical protein